VKAIRTVSETETTRTIEGCGIPFGGPFAGNADDYGTRATPRTNFFWDLFPDRAPTDPPDVPARYTRPMTYSHGFDSAIGLARIGGWSPVRQDKKGVWVQAQLDKREAWYASIGELLDRDALSFSSASVEHSARIARNGDWVDWPVFELALTPTPSNPWAELTARAAKTNATLFRVVRKGPPEGGIDRKDIPAEDFAGPNQTFPIVTPSSAEDAGSLIGKADDPDAVKAKIIAIAKRKGPDFVAALPEAWKDAVKMSAHRCAFCDLSMATSIQSQIADLMGYELEEPDQVAFLKAAFDAMGQFVAAEVEEIGAEDVTDQDEPGFAWSSSHLAHRIGKRNNGIDQASIDAMHDLTVKLGASAHAGDTPPNDESNQEPEPESSETQPPLDRSARPTRPETVALPDRIRVIGLPGS